MEKAKDDFETAIKEKIRIIDKEGDDLNDELERTRQEIDSLDKKRKGCDDGSFRIESIKKIVESCEFLNHVPSLEKEIYKLVIHYGCLTDEMIKKEITNKQFLRSDYYLTLAEMLKARKSGKRIKNGKILFEIYKKENKSSYTDKIVGIIDEEIWREYRIKNEYRDIITVLNRLNRASILQMCQQKELKNWDAAKLSGTLRKMVNEGILENHIKIIWHILILPDGELNPEYKYS